MDDAVEPRKQTGCRGSAASRHKASQMSSTFRQIFDTRTKCTNIRLMLSVAIIPKEKKLLASYATPIPSPAYMRRRRQPQEIPEDSRHM